MDVDHDAPAAAASASSAAAPAGASSSAPPGETILETPFVEKYRPVLLSDIVGNGDTIRRLEAIAADGNMPNLIIAGPPGTGKTTSILCLARALLGAARPEAVLELNVRALTRGGRARARGWVCCGARARALSRARGAAASRLPRRPPTTAASTSCATRSSSLRRRR
jgi:hypothetical protein